MKSQSEAVGSVAELNSDCSPPFRYSTFVRIGSGLTFADYVWIRQKNWMPLDKNNLPSWYQASRRGNEDKGDVYLEPEECVLIFSSDLYTFRSQTTIQALSY